MVTDQTLAHDALGGYVPAELTLHDAHVLRISEPDVYIGRSMRSMAETTVQAILAFQAAGAVAFDYGNNLRAQAQEAGVANAFDYPGFVPAFIRPCSARARAPSAGSRCPVIRRISAGPTRRCSSCSPTTARSGGTGL